MIQEIDWQVGGLLDALDELDLSENTLVIFASDNGPQLNVDGHGSSGPLRDGKWSNFEGGIRVPCLMRWPARIPAGSRNQEITAIYDILPTLCAITETPLPTDRVLDGRNLLPYLLGESVEPIHDRFIVPGVAIRQGDWKLFLKTQKPGGGVKVGKGMQGRQSAPAGSLFHLGEDVGETTDLSAQHPDRVAAMTQLMQEFVTEFDGQLRPVGKTRVWTPQSGEKPGKEEK